MGIHGHLCYYNTNSHELSTNFIRNYSRAANMQLRCKARRIELAISPEPALQICIFSLKAAICKGAALRGKCYRLTLRVVTLPSGDVRRTT